MRMRTRLLFGTARPPPTLPLAVDKQHCRDSETHPAAGADGHPWAFAPEVRQGSDLDRAPQCRLEQMSGAASRSEPSAIPEVRSSASE